MNPKFDYKCDELNCPMCYPKSTKKISSIKNEEECDMAYETTNTKVTDIYLKKDNTKSLSQEYFRRRVEGIYQKKDFELRVICGIVNDLSPTSAKEAVERIKAGNFSYPEAKNDFGVNSIIWRNPNKKTDRKVYEDALKTLDFYKNRAMDLIMSGDSSNFFTTIQEFESVTIKPTNN